MVGQVKSLKEIVATKDLQALDNQLSHAKLKLGAFGARKVVVQDYSSISNPTKDLSLNSIISAFEKIVCAEGANFDVDQAKRIYDKLKFLQTRNAKLMMHIDQDHFRLLTLWNGEDNQRVVFTEWDNINLTMWLQIHNVQPTAEFLPKIRFEGEEVANDNNHLKISKLPQELSS